MPKAKGGGNRSRNSRPRYPENKPSKTGNPSGKDKSNNTSGRAGRSSKAPSKSK